MIITLQNGTIQASIDTLGAQLISLKDAAGKEYLWQRDPAIWSRCAPLLFPAIGNCRNGRTMFHGTWYDLPKHGFARDCEFTLQKQEAASAVFRLTASDATRQYYPFDFVLTMTYELNGDTLSVRHQVENPGNTDLGYHIGAHPGFLCPMNEGETFEDYQLEFEYEETDTARVYDLTTLAFKAESDGYELHNSRILPLKYDLFYSDAVFFEHLRSRRVSLVHAQTGKGIQVAFPGFSAVAFWTPFETKGNLLAIEPWNGSAIRANEDDEFFHRHDLQLLHPGQTKDYVMEIGIL